LKLKYRNKASRQETKDLLEQKISAAARWIDRIDQRRREQTARPLSTAPIQRLEYSILLITALSNDKPEIPGKL
jgi:hypothetical protein